MTVQLTRSQTIAENTNSIAREMTETALSSRLAKTERLRKARIAFQATLVPTAIKKTKPKTSARASTKG